ncbi:MAG: terpene cyclase/mutase family protein [Kiritimatiellaeota bacterium]|nr:terpene cyclase/mutase family protein [Kiritimatiellota bacterium]
MRKTKTKIILLLCGLTAFVCSAEDIFSPRTGVEVPPLVEKMYLKGLKYLAATQNGSGAWTDTYGSQPGVVGLCVVAMLAHGDDPNLGTYSTNIKKGVDFILRNANPGNGFIGSSMYNHGFATLALAESYGMVDDDRIGPALKKAVALILTSQARNPMRAWRYSPESNDADTTVSGAVLVALLAAANAGIPVPEKAVDDALKFYMLTQSADGGFGYTGPNGSNLPRSAIGALVFSLAGRKKTNAYKRAIEYITQRQNMMQTGNYYYYYLYYGAQAFFHAPKRELWERWNATNIKALNMLQGSDGAWSGSYGNSFSTSAALLSLALNYRYLPIYER